jgi:uncharacterized SAM-dependent methyltransferase
METFMNVALQAAACATAVPRSTAFAHDVLTGLEQPQRLVPGRWLYDQRGRQLLTQLERLDEHYPARAEAALLRRAVPQIARSSTRGAVVVELGRGTQGMSELLLAAVDASAHVPLDLQTADFTQPRVLRAAVDERCARQHVVFFPGSTIDHFPPSGVIALLDNIGQVLGRGTLMVVSADTTQDPARLMPAYDDREGLWAEFSRNLLLRINRELGGNFETTAFEHQARWVAARHRVELHLVAGRAHVAHVQGQRFAFAAGQSIRTQTFHKHTLLMFRALVRNAGWAQREFWMDPRSGFALHLLEYVA